MKKILICPGDMPAVAFLAQSAPLVNLPLLGQPLIVHWMEWLASGGIKDVLVLATDRPEQVRDLLSHGVRWGLRVTVQSELRELSAEDAVEKYAPQGWNCSAAIIDHLPDLPEFQLFSSYGQWFAAVQALLPRAAEMNRLGFRSLMPGVWIGRRAQLHATAQLAPPCWIGENVRVGPHAVIGPRAVLEDGVVVETAAEIADSVVGPETFVGAFTKVQNSLAWGSTLINWRSGSCAHVPDAFLLSSLSRQSLSGTGANWSDGWTLALSRAWQYLTKGR